MQADHSRDAREAEDELAQAAERACTSLYTQVTFNIARHGGVSLSVFWSLLVALDGAAGHRCTEEGPSKTQTSYCPVGGQQQRRCRPEKMQNMRPAGTRQGRVHPFKRGAQFNIARRMNS